METAVVHIIVAIVLLAVVAVLWTAHHQRSLRRRAEVMQEAIRNRDFTFRLPTDGMLSGERAMQETLNQLGNTIRRQVNKSEVESWERLTRVLTHEIMNATAPIASISQSMLQRPDVKGTQIEEGIHAIFAASTHLNTFVDSYRSLSQLQQPVICAVRLTEVVADVRQLYPGVEWTVDVDDGCRVSADANMLRQVLINLVKNAIEAGATGIGMELNNEDGHVCLCVSNDGPSIPAEARSSIFIPFFTTKRTGSGIGLSLSRRMMIQQGGGIELADHPHSPFHTTFNVLLKNGE